MTSVVKTDNVNPLNAAAVTMPAVTITGGSITGITDLAVADGGTGASTASGALTNLGAAASGANTDITSLNAPALGAATATTAAAGDSTTKVSTTAFVQGELSGFARTAVRQTQRLGPVDSSGYNATLSAGSGLNFNVDASPTAVVLDFAAGSADYTATITADATNQGALVASNTNFVHATYVNATSVTWGNCLVPPQEGFAFDRTQNILCNYQDSNGATTTTCDFGNAVTLSGATISTAQFKFGSSSLRIGGAGHYASIPFTSFGDGSWEVEDWFRPDTAASGSAQQVFILSNGGGYGANVYIDSTGHIKVDLSSNGTSADIGSTAGSTVLSNGTWYKARLVFDALAGTYRLYLSNNGAAETQEVTISSSARICAVTSAVVGHSSAAMIGYHGAFRVLRCAHKTGTETPSASAPTVTDYPVHFFSIPAMTMYEVTAASASAGTNPTLTARNRVFVGEADTNGSAITATRNYALRGQYIGQLGNIPGTSVNTSVNTNLGTVRAHARVELVCQTASSGYLPGAVITDVCQFDGTYLRPISVHRTRNTAAFGSGSSQAVQYTGSTGGSAQATSPTWLQRIVAQRSY